MPTYSHWDIALLQGIQVNRFCALVSFTILYFDYFIVFSTEVERFWKGFTLSWASALFVANRYLSLVASIPILLEYFGDPPEPRCRQLQSFHQYLALLTQGTVAALLLIRTYALYNRSKHILYLMLITCFAGGAVSAWSIMSDGKYVSDADSSLLRLSGCDLSLSNQQGRHISIAWGSMLVFDTLIFALTVAKIIKSDKKIWKGTLFKLMLRDGAIYYGIMVVINIANIVTFVVRTPNLKHRVLLNHVGLY
ncbi:hypothetical protein OBBRIDRAFT_774740 [Obba rivulosa]|uniref:DUF6533 domain-containing protein n=1 Tax=Obba rivulosa TaxID=1052685 RepID=A0A8E2AVD8_9APHY|nr:hypothetical protein OBBRIDRAFT_774740 [Obba rivulosa]